jgi:hypothetical protein
MSRGLLKTGRHNIHEENGRRYKFDVGDKVFIEANLLVN